jgi:hypothetical protein
MLVVICTDCMVVVNPIIPSLSVLKKRLLILLITNAACLAETQQIPMLIVFGVNRIRDLLHSRRACTLTYDSTVITTHLSGIRTHNVSGDMH